MLSEVEKRIKECIAELEPYRYYSGDADSGIRELRRLQDRIKNLNQENLEDTLEWVKDGYRRSLAYQSYVPKTVSNLRFIKEWLEKRRETSQK